MWLIVAVAAMFAAFPAWYATMLSGFYPVIVALIVALIARGLSFEYRGKRPSRRWRRTWDALMTGGSLAAPFLIGLSLGDLLHGVPIGRNQEFAGSLGSLFPPYAIFAGLTLTAVCVLHGATFLALKTAGEVRARAGRLARVGGAGRGPGRGGPRGLDARHRGARRAAEPGGAHGHRGGRRRGVAGGRSPGGLGLHRDDGDHGGQRPGDICRSVSARDGVNAPSRGTT